MWFIVFCSVFQIILQDFLHGNEWFSIWGHQQSCKRYNSCVTYIADKKGKRMLGYPWHSEFLTSCNKVNGFTTLWQLWKRMAWCLDARNLTYLIRNVHYTASWEDAQHSFKNGQNYFSTLSGCWTKQLSEESQPLTAFNTPFKKYCFQRCGISVSAEIFCHHMETALDGTPDLFDWCSSSCYSVAFTTQFYSFKLIRLSTCIFLDQLVFFDMAHK